MKEENKNKLAREDALELIDRMPYITTINASNISLRLKLYKEAVESDDPLKWIKVIKSCYMRSQEKSGRHINLLENEYGDIARKKLYGILSESLGINKDEVEKFIIVYISKNI